MSEENTAPEAGTESTTETTTPEQSEGQWLETLPEEARKEIQKLRKEAAARRVLSKEQEAELAEYRKYKESQMTELEKAQARIEELESRASEGDRMKAVIEAKLDPDLAEFVRGSSYDEMLESAKTLVGKLGPASTGDRRPDFSGRRGTPITEDGQSMAERANDMMRNLMREAR